MYLVVSKNNHFNINEIYHETNENKFFHLYDNIEVAAMMSATYQAGLDYKIFQVTAEHLISNDGIRLVFEKVKILNEVELPKFTTEQRILFAVLCTLDVISNKFFESWANEYLTKVDQSVKTADAMWDILSDELEVEHGIRSYDYLDCAFPMLSAIRFPEQAEFFAANTVHKAWYDSLEMNKKIDLNRHFLIIKNLSAQQIAEIFTQ